MKLPEAAGAAGALAAGLLILAPLGAVYVRHWFSAAFVLLVMLMLISFREWWPRLTSDETTRRILVLSIAFFLSYVLSASLNGWDSGSTRALEREMRLLMLAPLAAFLAILPSIRILGIGCLVAVFFTGAAVGYDHLVLDKGRDLGVYGPLFTGPACVLFLIGSLGYSLTVHSSLRRLTCLALSFLTVAFVTSVTSRSAMVGLLIVLIGITLLDARHRRFFLSLGSICVFGILASQLLGEGSDGPSFLQGILELTSYLEHEVTHMLGHNPVGATSVGARLEMFKASIFIFSESPIFGIGPRNFMPAVLNLKEAGIIHPDMPTYHPHNIFLEALVSKGLLGLSLFIALLSTITRAVLRCSELARHLGLIFLSAVLVMMFTESAILIKNNFSSLFVLFLAAFLSDRLTSRAKNLNVSE